MQTLYVKFINIIVLIMLLSSCVQLRFPQVDTIKQWISPPLPALNNFRWTLTVEGYTDSVILYQIKGYNIFLAKEKHGLLYNNQIIEQISILQGETLSLRITDIELDEPNNELYSIKRQLFIKDTLYETQLCTPWSESNQFKQTQTCKGQLISVNEKQYNEKDELVGIKQYIPYINKNITLVKQYQN